jgi:hypothetical protein
MTDRSAIIRAAWRKVGLWSAGVAAVVALVACSGCNEQIRQDVRQGAYDVFSAGLSSFYSAVSSGITNGISDLASQNTSSQTP